MPDEAEKADATQAIQADGTGEAEENERPTVSPPFDPAQFAREVSKPSLTPSWTAPVISETPPGGLPQAGSNTFRPEAVTPIPDETRPLASRMSASYESASTLAAAAAVDEEWTELELATRPPPALSARDPLEAALPLVGPSPAAPGLLELDPLEPPVESGATTVRRPAMPPDSQDAARSSAITAPPKPRSVEMNDLIELGDYSGALEIAEVILSEKPDDIGARTVAETCRTVLRQMYATRIGPLDRVPVVMVPRDQLRWLSIDHKAGFVLSLVDGVSSLEMIIDVSGMPELDTLRILSELAQQRIIALR